MSLGNVIIGVVLGLLLAVPIIAWRERYRDVFAVILVLGIAALGAAVTVYRVQQFRQQHALNSELAQSAGTTPQMSTGTFGSTEPARPPVIIPAPGPMMQGPGGAAAPPAAKNPHLRTGNA